MTLYQWLYRPQYPACTFVSARGDPVRIERAPFCFTITRTAVPEVLECYGTALLRTFGPDQEVTPVEEAPGC